MENVEKINLVKSIICGAMKANHFITVDFIKKTTGEKRHMVCHRAKVLEKTVSETPSAETLKRKATLKARNILCVEEMAENGVHQFRSIPLENVTRVAASGQVVEF